MPSLESSKGEINEGGERLRKAKALIERLINGVDDYPETKKINSLPDVANLRVHFFNPDFDPNETEIDDPRLINEYLPAEDMMAGALKEYVENFKRKLSQEFFQEMTEAELTMKDTAELEAIFNKRLKDSFPAEFEVVPSRVL